MIKVRCISPHGGLREGDPRHGLPPSERGYVDNKILGRVEVGTVVDAPDDFIIDGFHFEAAESPAAPPGIPSPAPAAASPPTAAPATPAGTEGTK